MPQRKAKRPKESNLLERKNTSKNIPNKISLDKIVERFFSIRELKEKYLSHKRTLRMEEPKTNLRKKAIRENSTGQKSKSIKRMKNGMGMRNT